ncbi:MAG: RluA family pseudouridine synthase [Lachnospiraceae bacterium]|nr:RluA family pseudouridine synthase [Lachnospiraceae bacterium]
MKSFIINKAQAGQRLDKYLKRIMPNAQTSLLYKSLRKKNITLNNKKAEGKELLKEGDEVKVFFRDETFEAFLGTQMQKTVSSVTSCQKVYEARPDAAKVVYEDEDVLVLDKAAGFLSQKAKPEDLSINEWMIGYLLSKQSVSAESLSMFKPSVCNRLDRNTSGLVLCGKSLQGSQVLSNVLKERTLDKFYLTYVQGKLCEEIKHHAFLIKNDKTNKVHVYASKKEAEEKLAEGQKLSEIITWIKPVAYDKDYDITKLEIKLVTGKSHQIRAHLSYLGYPILGDTKYGYKETVKDLQIHVHQMLHAYKVCFTEQFALDTLKGKTIETMLPKAFQQLEKQICLRGIPED